LIAVLLAHSTNLGLTRMAEASVLEASIGTASGYDARAPIDPSI
jgi:hypothetical protein